MTYPISLDLQSKPSQNLKQTQRLIMSPQMQQAINLLQMPVLELSAVLEQELQQNPIVDFMEDNEDEHSDLAQLEAEHAEEEIEKEQKPENELNFDERDFEILKKLDEDFRDQFADTYMVRSQRTSEDDKLKTFQESSICAEQSLFEFLMSQAHEIFSEEDLRWAEALIGNFDENGFLKTSLQEVSLLNQMNEKKLGEILEQIQTFEPHGVGAVDLHNSLLIQLRAQNKKDTLAYRILEEHYDDLIHNRIPIIVKSMHLSSDQITTAIKKDISRLDLHPGLGHFKNFVQYITPDVTIEEENQNLVIKVNDDFMPSIRINRRYLRMMEDENVPVETKEFIKTKLASAKWLLRNVHQRSETLQKIVELLIQTQRSFFMDPNGKLEPLTMKTLAEQLELHESTIARAVANKYVDSPRGILPLRSFFTNSLATQNGEDVSSNTARNVLLDIINGEDKMKPLSDADLSRSLEEKGISCARRTIAKYRTELQLGNAQQRRKYSSH